MPEAKDLTKKFGEPSQVDTKTPSLRRDDWLEGVIVGYRENTYVMDQFFPEQLVKKISAKFRVYSPKGRFKAAAKRAETALPEQAALQYSEDTYSAEEYAMEGWVSDEAVDNAANDITPLADEAEYLAGRILLAQELKSVAELLAAVKAVGATYYTLLDANTNWSSGASADILGDFSTAIRGVTTNTGKRPNMIGMDTNTSEVIINNSTIVDILKRNSVSVITDENPVPRMRGMQVHLADALVNIGTYDAPSYVNVLYDVDVAVALKQCVVVAYVKPSDKLTLARNFVPQGYQAFQGRDLEGDRRKATLVYVSKKIAPKVCNVGACHLIGNVLGA